MMAISSTNPKVTEVGSYIFRICFIDPFQGAVLSKFAHDSLHAKRVALLTAVNSPYSIGLSSVLRQDFTARGGEIVAEQKYVEGDKDFRAQLTAIRSTHPDVIAATGFYSEAALIWAALSLSMGAWIFRLAASPAAILTSFAARLSRNPAAWRPAMT